MKKEQVPLSVMDKLLLDKIIKVPKVGDSMSGIILDIGTNAIYLDLGPIGTGVVMGEELNDGFGITKTLKIGDEVEATVVELDNEDGYFELSLRQASEDKVWEDLAQKEDSAEPVGVKILDANKGGLMVQLNGVSGFLPVSQLAFDHYPRVDGGDKSKILSKLQEYIGQTFTVGVIAANREEEKLIVSEKVARKSEELTLINSYQKSDVVEGEVTGVVDFGVFMKFGEENRKIEGLVHISEISWQLVEDPRELYKEGDRVKAKIIDVSQGKISLSIKSLLTDPWKKAAENYKEGSEVEGKVVKNNHFGLFIQLDNELRGLVHSSEIEKNKSKYNLPVGTVAKFVVLSVEPNEHRISLALVE